MIQGVSDSALMNNTQRQSNSTKKTTITPFRKVFEKTTATPLGTPVNKANENENSTVEGGKITLKNIFEEASSKYDISYDLLVAVAKAESNFNPGSTSGKGAQGIMQLMPATAKELGVKDAYDVKQNIMAGAKYLSAHLKAFNGNVDYAVAAYNAGGGAVRKYGGIPPYSETQNYVKKVNKYMKEGVTVPDRTIAVSAAGQKEKGTDNISDAVAATEQERMNSKVVVGSGDSAMTMTYSAYLKYLELGTAGVG